MGRLRSDDPADRPKQNNPQQSSRSSRWVHESGKKHDAALIKSALKSTNERPRRRKNRKQVKNTETANR
jgi:hypothetical protein